MIWAEVGKVAAAVALMAISAGVVIVLVKRMEASQVEQKGITLLQLWLSPDQAEQYSSYGHFEVIGSDTGKRYRIRHARMMNVDELDRVGNEGLVSDELIFQSQMVLDPDHPGHILRKYFERVPLGPIADAAPQIDHTAMHHDIDGGAR
jgi:hypothetical protein